MSSLHFHFLIIYHDVFTFFNLLTMKSSSSDPASSDSQCHPKTSTNKKSLTSTNRTNGNGATSKKSDSNDGPRQQRSGVNKHRNNPNDNNNNENPNPKRRRYSKQQQPRPRPPHNNNILPEARVIQDPSDCALISDSDHDDDNIVDCTCCKCYSRDAAANDDHDRLLQESIERHTRLLSFRRNPEFFVVVHRSGNDVFGDDDF